MDHRLWTMDIQPNKTMDHRLWTMDFLNKHEPQLN